MPKNSNRAKPENSELTAIKKLLVLKLLRDGVTQKQIGMVLGLDHSNISRMVPSSAFKASRKKGHGA